MKKISLLMVLCCTMIVVANTSYEPQAFDTIVVGQDTLLAPRHPEPVHLYLHPVRKATAACPLDSTVGLDANENYASKIEYEYDEAGHTIIETQYQWVNGVKTGVSKYWKKYTGNTATTTVNYKWDATLNNWVNNDSTQYLYYDNGKMKSNAKYQWENGAWRYASLVEYEYDAAGNITLSLNSSWNSTQQALVYTTKREYAYDAQKRKTLDASWKFTNNAWTGTTKSVNEYDANGNKVIEESYSGWENNDWKGSSKNTYTYNSANKVLEQITYTWSSGWVESKKIVKDYDGSNIKEDATYTWKNSEWVGTSRKTTTWVDGKKTEDIQYSWNSTNKDWQNSTKIEYIYTGSNLTTQANYKWVEAAWVGISKTETTYTTANKVATRTTYTWSEGNWVGIQREENTYDSANRPTCELKQTWNGTDWANNTRTLYEYNARGLNSLKVNDKWDGTVWQATDSAKHEINYTTIAGKELTLSDIQTKWTSTNGIWSGVSKSEYMYDEVGNQIQSDTYTYSNGAWVNKERRQTAYKDNNPSLKTLEMAMNWQNDTWVGNFKYEYTYDETNRRISYARYSWDKTSGNWRGESKSEEVWQNNQKVTDISYNWDKTNLTWYGSFKHDYKYDQKGNIIEHIQLRYKNNAWNNEYKYIYEFDSKHSEAIRSDVYVWNADDEDWCFQSKNEISYDDDADGKLRYQLDAAYTNCVLSTYDLKRYYYRCDPKQFTIIFNNWDGSQLTTFKAEEGITPAYPSDLDTPAKGSDAQYSYIFKGWDKELVPVTGDATYTAVFEQNVNSYTITFVNEDNSPLQSTEVAYGTTPEYTGTTPAKGGDTQYSYTFKGWDKELVPVTGDATYTAVFEQNVNTYTINFVNEDNSPLQSTEVAYGTTPEYTGTTPAKGGDAQYSYTFKGWDKELVPVTGDATYTAVFEQNVNTYTINFVNEDNSPLQSTDVAYGTTPEYTGTTPAKGGDAQYSYTFKGWDKELVPVTGDATYTAVFEQNVNTYTINFVNEDNSPLQSTEVAYGTTPEYTGTTPAKGGDAQYSYTFKGWDKELVPVTGDATYTAVFEQSVNTYDVTFEVKGDASKSYTIEDVPYGTMVNELAEQVKTLFGTTFEDDTYIYTFTGLENVTETDIVTENATFYVLYSAEPKKPTDIDHIEQSAGATKVMENGVLYIIRDGKRYHTTGTLAD